MERADRIGAWVSGIAHAGLIGWVAVGGVFFRAEPLEAIRMTAVSTMSDRSVCDGSCCVSSCRECALGTNSASAASMHT